MTCRILCTGDLHIGRRASKVQGTYRSSEAWKTIVELAISERVDLVAISGDIVDKSNAQYEAIGPLQDGLRRLDEAGIETFVVAGNHDHNVLPRLARVINSDRFHVLGQQETWHSHIFERAGNPILQIVGWSFPSEHVHQNPMRSFQKSSSIGLPVIALLHADIGNLRSLYGPVSLDDFWNQDVDVWLLGHIHVSGVFDGPRGRFVIYPGSPYAMDPGEPGRHGAWIIEFEPGGQIGRKLIPISPVRYESIVVDLSDINDEEGFLFTIAGALDSLRELAMREADGIYLKEISCRLNLIGSTSVHRSVPGWSDRARNDLDYSSGSVIVRIDEITSDVRPIVDLQQLAAGNDPVAETARVLIALSQDLMDTPYMELVERTHRGLQAVHSHSGYFSLRNVDSEESTTEPTEHDARQLLMEKSWQLLSALYSQKEAL